MLRFNFDAQAGETPASIAQKRALIAQLMGSARTPRTLGEGFAALGDGIVANVEGGRARDAEVKGQESANSTFSALTSMLTGQGGSTQSSPSAGGSDFMTGLINSESGGNWGALNDEGYGGRLQFGDARLADAAAAGIIPPGVTGAAFSRMSPEQQQAVEAWHFADIEQQAERMGLNQYYGQTIAGVPITPESVKAMSHLGGIGGAQKFITSGGRYNPADSNGTRLSDYGARFGGSSGEAPPVQVASLDPSIGAPVQAQPAQLPPIGPTGGPSMAAVPQAPAVQPQAPMASQPVQTAQGPSLQMLMEAAANPWLNESQKAIINSMITQQMQQQAQANDPLRQLQIQAAEQGLNAPIEVGGVLLDRETMEPIFDSRAAKGEGLINAGDGNIYNPATGEWITAPASAETDMTDTQRNLSWRAEQAGLTAGTPEYAEFMRSGGQSTGMALSVGPDGTVQFSQGGVGGKPLTEAQSKDAVFVTRANNALPTIDKYENALLSLGENVAGNIPYGNILQSEEYQVARDAGREFLATVLRKDTGAAVTPSEEAMYGDMLLPRPGDKPATIEMKRRRRAVAVQAIEAGMPPQAILNSVAALEGAGVVDAQGNVMPDGMNTPTPNQSTPADIDDILKGYGL